MRTVEDESDAAVIAASLDDPVRFGTIFDRHATVLHRYLVRRLGPDEAEAMVGEVFRIAFEKRDTYDLLRPVARPWLYGIATNLLAKQRRREARRIHAMARLAAQRLSPVDDADRVSAVVDASRHWQRVAHAVMSAGARTRCARAPRMGGAELRGDRRRGRPARRHRAVTDSPGAHTTS
jgi:DNA-directed RNA polymerase specialized sigma24 family protein